MASQEVAIRKHQQISKANRTMFIWVAIASAILGFALVVSYYMYQKMSYNHKVIGKQDASIKVIKGNLASVDELKKNVRVVNTSEALSRLRVNDSDQPAQVILDALPAYANSAAVGASLQSPKMLGDSGITLETMVVTPIQGAESSGGSSKTTNSGSQSGSKSNYQRILFSFTVNVDAGNESDLKKAISNLERSIRIINVTSLKIESQSQKTTMKVEGEAYYQPSVDLSLKYEAVKP